MHWEIHPPRPSRFPSGVDFAPLGPRDFPRASPSGNLSGLGVQNPRPWEISRASGDVFPNTSLLSAVYGYIPSFRKYIASFKSIETFLTVTLDDLEKAPAHDIDNYFKDLFDSMRSRSVDVKDVCSHFIAAIREAKTDLAA